MQIKSFKKVRKVRFLWSDCKKVCTIQKIYVPLHIVLRVLSTYRHVETIIIEKYET